MRSILTLTVILGLAGAAHAADAAGKTVYGGKCASCHGKDGKGNPGMAKAFKVELQALDLSDESTQAKTDETLSGVVSKGSGKMPAYTGKLSEAEIGDLMAYVRSFAVVVTTAGPDPATSAARKAADPAAAKTFAAKCATCHGKDARGVASMAKMFKVEPAKLDLTASKKSAEEIAGFLGGKAVKPDHSSKLPEAERAGMAAYLSSLVPAEADTK